MAQLKLNRIIFVKLTLSWAQWHAPKDSVNILYLDKQINDKILNSSQNSKYQNLILRVPKKEF